MEQHAVKTAEKLLKRAKRSHAGMPLIAQHGCGRCGVLSLDKIARRIGCDLNRLTKCMGRGARKTEAWARCVQCGGVEYFPSCAGVSVPHALLTLSTGIGLGPKLTVESP